jgi:hypothetical protein
MKKARKVPVVFASEAEERAYWEGEDSTADLDWGRAKRVRLPNLQPATTAVSRIGERLSIQSRPE